MARRDNSDYNTSNEDTQANRTAKKMRPRRKKSSKPKVSTTMVCISTSTTTPAVEQSHISNALSLVPVVPQVMPSITPYHQTFSQPYPIQDWRPIISAIPPPNPVYAMPYQPLPVTILPPPVIHAPMCPLNYAVIPRMVAPISTQPVSTDVPDASAHVYESASYYTDKTFSNPNEDAAACSTTVEQNVHGETSQINLNEDATVNTTEEQDTLVDNQDVQEYQNPTPSDPLEEYLTLPREMFPTPRMLKVDPNSIIDEFCKLSNVGYHVPWILDLEFGVPKSPGTRPLPTYDVKFNSIHCKNAPGAIHPGFESCNEEFKRALLFYYDCVVSSWYRGFVIFNCDYSVENFQSWLHSPMQGFGMCWP